jgi:hypothetical protein
MQIKNGTVALSKLVCSFFLVRKSKQQLPDHEKNLAVVVYRKFLKYIDTYNII